MTKQIYFLLFILIAIASCSSQEKKQANAGGSNEGSATSPFVLPGTNAPVKPGNSLPPEDLSFRKPNDIVSAYGPDCITRNILQDRNGTIWLATWDGVIRYDGKLFTNVTWKEGLKHFRVFSILEDLAGNLWFGTIGGGVYRYDGTSFTYFTNRDGLAGNVILCMLADKSGNIWFGTQDGVSRYDGRVFTNFTMQHGLNSNLVHTIEQDRTGKLWFGTQGGVNCYDPSTSNTNGGKLFTNFKDKAGSNFYIVQSILEDKNGNIWIASTDGLTRYDGKTLTTVTGISPYCIFEDKTGDLWLNGGEADGKGMILFRYNGKSFIEIKHDKQVFEITQDRTGNIWFGTVHGACRYDGKTFTDFNAHNP